jgi:hypothetical protein
MASTTEQTTPNEDIVAQRKLKFLNFVIEKSKKDKKLLGYLQVLSRQFGAVEQ